MSTVLATVPVNDASCFGRSSESATRVSRVPVLIFHRLICQLSWHSEDVYDLERGYLQLGQVRARFG